MGCACKVNQRINEIQKIYGHGKNKNIKTNTSGTIIILLKQFLIYLLCIPFIPIIIIFLLLNSLFFKKPISIKKILKIKK